MRKELKHNTIFDDVFRTMVQKMPELLEEYEKIRQGLEVELYEEGKSVLYEDLINLIVLISDYMIQSKEVRERLGDVMGGKVLELESERLLRIGREEGRQEGHAEGALETMIAMYRAGIVTLEYACEYLGISAEEFIEKYKNNKQP